MKASTDRARWLLAGAAIAVLAYFVLVHWWFTAPMMAMGEEISRLRDEQLSLRMEIAQRPALEAELQRVRAFEAGNTAYLPEANRQLATASLVQRLEAVVSEASQGSSRCQITARTPTEGRSDEPFVRATVQVRLRCGMPELAAVLYELESGSPQLFVDNLDLLSRASYLGAAQESGAVDVNFNLYGYLLDVQGVPVLDSLRPVNVLPAALAAWALALLLLAMAGLGANFGPHPDDPTLAPALPQAELTEIGLALGPPSQYAEVAQRPLLIPSRRPAAVSDAGEQDAPLDFTLTGVLLAGEFRAAMLQSPDGSRNERVREGNLVEGTSWRLVSLEPRAAVFQGPEGERRLDLRLYDGSADPARPQAAAAPPPGQARSGRRGRGSEPATNPAASDAQGQEAPKEAEAMSEEQQVEAIRRRIEARRAQMREQSAREGQKVE